MQASARLSSSAAFRKVIAGVSSATTRSCYRTSRGKAHAAPLPAQEPPPKGRKRISIQERRALIVEFVENYRASNGGKFPTITNTRQQIGGCHYTVRAVLQEMVYNHAKLPLDNAEAESKSYKGNPKLEESHAKLPLQGTDEVTEHPVQKDEARVLENQGILEVPEHLMAEDDAGMAQRQGTVEVYENSLPKDEGEVDQFQGIESESFKVNPKLEEATNTGLFGSLKSFAYGIRNFWKNM